MCVFASDFHDFTLLEPVIAVCFLGQQPVVGYHDDGLALLMGQSFQRISDGIGIFFVQISCWLVCGDHIGVGSQSPAVVCRPTGSQSVSH